jgi:hypothetical protein
MNSCHAKFAASARVAAAAPPGMSAGTSGETVISLCALEAAAPSSIVQRLEVTKSPDLIAPSPDIELFEAWLR